MSLASLSWLTLANRPVQAQEPSGGWTVEQCDAQGNPTSSIMGTETGQSNNTYPAGMVAAGDFAFYPLTPNSTPFSTPFYDDTIGVDPPASGASADNYYNNGYGDSGTFYASDGSSSPVNGSMSVNLTGQIPAYYKEVWQGSGTPTTPMPTHIDFLLNTEVYASAAVNYGSSGLSSGLSATADVSDGDPFNERVMATAGDAGSNGNPPPVLGHHLVRASVDPGTGIAEVYLNGTTYWTASNQVPYMIPSSNPSAPPMYNGATSANASGYVNVGIKQDNREVSISCPTIETSYYKANVDAQHPDGRWAHVPDPVSGAVTGDSVVVYTAGQNAISVNEYGDAFNALCSGFNHPYYTWSFNGSDGTVGPYSQQYLNNESDQYNSLPLDVNFGSDFSGYPKSGTVKVSVRDGSDNATAANTYAVTWHLPYEAYSYLGQTGIGKTVENTLVSGVYPSASYDLPATDAEDFDVSAAFDAGEAITAAAGQEEAAGLFKVAASIAKLTNLKFSYGGDKASSGNRNDGTSWSVAQNDNGDAYGGGNVNPAQLASNPTGWQLCKLSWCVVVKWHENSWNTDKYTINGYDSSNHLLVVHTTDTVDEEPYFTQYQNPDGTPYPGT